MAEVVRVWGRADNIEIEMTKSNGRWLFKLPPDTVDGQYAVQLFATKGNGQIATWTGILYVSNGVCCLKLKPEKYTLWLCPERITLKLVRKCCHMCNNEERKVYHVGARDTIEWEITPNKKIYTVVPTEAKYELYKDGKVIDSGNASVNIVDGKHNVSVLFNANEVGAFKLRIFVTIPPETKVAEVYIDVTR